MASSRKKIPTGTDSFLDFNPFSALGSEGLPSKVTTPVPSAPVKPEKETVRKKGEIRLRRETSGRAGKGVVVVYGDALNNQSDSMLDDLLKTLKGRCACGGTRKGKALEIQGDHRESLRDYLSGLGYRVIFSGG